MKCKHCGKEITKGIALGWWIHTDEFFNCAGRSGHAETYAEPENVEEIKYKKLEEFLDLGSDEGE